MAASADLFLSLHPLYPTASFQLQVSNDYIESNFLFKSPSSFQRPTSISSCKNRKGFEEYNTVRCLRWTSSVSTLNRGYSINGEIAHVFLIFQCLRRSASPSVEDGYFLYDPNILWAFSDFTLESTEMLVGRSLISTFTPANLSL